MEDEMKLEQEASTCTICDQSYLDHPYKLQINTCQFDHSCCNICYLTLFQKSKKAKCPSCQTVIYKQEKIPSQLKQQCMNQHVEFARSLLELYAPEKKIITLPSYDRRYKNWQEKKCILLEINEEQIVQDIIWKSS